MQMLCLLYINGLSYLISNYSNSVSGALLYLIKQALRPNTERKSGMYK